MALLHSFLPEEYLIIYTYHIFLIHSSVSGHLGYSQFAHMKCFAYPLYSINQIPPILQRPPEVILLLHEYFPPSSTTSHLWNVLEQKVHWLPGISDHGIGLSWQVRILSSVQFSRSVVSDSLQPHELQHARPPCPSPNPGVHSNSRPLSRWCHQAISSSVIPFSSCPQSLPASESFQMSQLFTWGGQSTGVSALASFLPKKSQEWSPLEWTGWISLQSKGLSRVFSNTTVQKHQFFRAQPSSQSNSHIHTWPQEKP